MAELRLKGADSSGFRGDAEQASSELTKHPGRCRVVVASHDGQRCVAARLTIADST